VYSDELFDIQRKFSEDTLLLLRELQPLMLPVTESAKCSEEEIDTISMLASAAERSSESAILLCSYGRLWDAELPIRSTFEATLKLSYMLQKEETFHARHQEYADDLFNIALMKDHQKACELLAALPTPEAAEWKPIRDRVMRDEELAELQDKYPKQKRAALERKWGFTGLIQALSTSGDLVFNGFQGLTHGYSVSSHIAHADYMGVSIPFDRDLRENERRMTAHLTHLTRLLSDSCICLYLRLLVGYRFIGENLQPIFEAGQRMEALRASFDPSYQEWLDIEYADKPQA
jgi:hypothetical protein